uniref:Uncharacterized protein n=1 Tax=Aquila chrysaetos chrysaetos TaxID=223781 RepID=A0A663ESD6_AQUCH
MACMELPSSRLAGLLSKAPASAERKRSQPLGMKLLTGGEHVCLRILRGKGLLLGYLGSDRAFPLLERGRCSRAGLPGSEPIATMPSPWQHTGQEHWEQASEAASVVPRSVDGEQKLKRGQRAARRSFLSIPGEGMIFGWGGVPCLLLSSPQHHPPTLQWWGVSTLLLGVSANAQNNLSALETFPLLVSAVPQLPVDLNPGQIRCSKREVVLTRGAERLATREDGRKLYDYFSSFEGIGGFQDHFDWWARNQFSSRGGKPLWIDPHDPSIHHIFIDDNIRLDDEDTIVHPQVFSEQGSSSPRRAPTSELYDVCLVQNDLLEAIADEDYFLRCVRRCEENYDRYLACMEKDTPSQRWDG